MDIRRVLTQFNKINYLGIELVGRSVFLLYRYSQDKTTSFRVAKSTDGLSFKYVKTVIDNYLPPKFNPTFIRLLGPCTIEGFVKISRGNLIIFHTINNEGQIEVGVALIKNRKIVFRSEYPLWISPSNWLKHQVKFIGLAHHGIKIIGYWQIDDENITAIIYPSYKRRNPETVKNNEISLKKHFTNPIISPRAQHKWESAQTFNPGVIMIGDKFHFLYRAIGEDGVSRLGYANSTDGSSINFRSNDPVFNHHLKSQKVTVSKLLTSSGGSWGGVEDPRLVRVGNEPIIYVTYTAVDGGLRVGLTSISVSDFTQGTFNWTPPICISPPGQVHKNWVIFPEKINNKYVILHGITPKISIEYLDDLQFNGKKYINSRIDPQQVTVQNDTWDKRLRGVGSPPIKTDKGWLIFYHSMDYKVGVMLLDLLDPTKIICRAKTPVLESAEFYEKTGYKPGIVYVSGACVREGTLYVYYGGADNFVCVAMTNLNDFLNSLTFVDTPELEPAKIFIINSL